MGKWDYNAWATCWGLACSVENWKLLNYQLFCSSNRRKAYQGHRNSNLK